MIKRNTGRALALVSLAGVGVAANAAVPAGAEAIFTTLATDFGTIAGYGFTLMAAVVGGLIVMKLVKKIANKSA